MGAAWVGAGEAAEDAVKGVGEVNGLAEFDHPATAKLTRTRRPMIDAFETGLFLYWITPQDVICALQPALSIEDGRLHCADGPAVSWPSGEAYYFWHGVQVPDWAIEKPDWITAEAIRAEPDEEVRRCLREVSERFRQQGP